MAPRITLYLLHAMIDCVAAQVPAEQRIGLQRLREELHAHVRHEAKRRGLLECRWCDNVVDSPPDDPHRVLSVTGSTTVCSACVADLNMADPVKTAR